MTFNKSNFGSCKNHSAIISFILCCIYPLAICWELSLALSDPINIYQPFPGCRNSPLHEFTVFKPDLIPLYLMISMVIFYLMNCVLNIISLLLICQSLLQIFPGAITLLKIETLVAHLLAMALAIRILGVAEKRLWQRPSNSLHEYCGWFKVGF